MQKLSDYAAAHGVTYRTAWNRYKRGAIPGAFKDHTGHVLVPTGTEALKQRCAIYARVSTHQHKDDLERQVNRLKEFATARGLEVTHVVQEVGSGVNDARSKLTALLGKHEEWGTLLVEHKDRLTRTSFTGYQQLLSLLGKDVLVAETYEDSDEGRMEDIFSLLYAFAASEHGNAEAKRRAERAAKALTDE